ncbi:MAG: hypothetical protein AB8G05_11540 [Oligoflexales bacterium]
MEEIVRSEQISYCMSLQIKEEEISATEQVAGKFTHEFNLE